MSENKMLVLINKLAERTGKGNLEWKSTEASGVYQTSFPKYSVRLAIRKNQRVADLDYVVQIIDNSGELVEEVDDTDFGSGDHYEVMKELYEGARRKAKGVDDALDSILEDLDEDEL